MPEALLTTGAKLTRDSTGLVSYDLKFIVACGQSDDALAFIQAFEPPKIANLAEKNRSATQREDGDWDLEIQYGGGDPSKFQETIELDHAGAEDPIESFTGYAALLKKYKGKTDENGNLICWPATINDEGRKVPNPLSGFMNYLNDGIVLRQTFNLENFTASLLRNLCKIEQPQIKTTRLAAMAEAPDGKNWLKKSVKVQFNGNCFQYSIEYLLSGPGGWVPDVYAPRAVGGSGLSSSS